MILDEEAAANMAATMPPGARTAAPMAQEGMDPELAAERAGMGEMEDDDMAEGNPRQATPVEQRAYETMARQALSLLTSDAGAQAVASRAELAGPERAIAQSVSEVLDGVEEAAQAAGVRVPPDVRAAATKPVVLVLAKLMAEGGMTRDPAALVRDALAMLDEAAMAPEDDEQEMPAAPMGQPMPQPV